MKKNESHAKVLVANTMWVYVGKLASQLLALVASVWVLRKLSVDVYGVFTFLLGLFSLFQLFILSPIKDAMNRFIPELSMHGNYASLRRVIVKSFIISILLTLVMLGVLYVLKLQVASFFNIQDFPLYYNEFFWYVIAFAVKSTIEVYFTSLLLHKHSSLYNIFSFLARAILYLVFINELTIPLLLWIETIVSVVFVLLCVMIVIRKYSVIRSLESKAYEGPQLTRRMMRYCGFSMLNELGAGVIGKTSDYYIISAMSNAYSVGLYGFALKVYDLCFKVLPVREFETVLRPLFFQRFSDGASEQDVNRVYNFIVKMLLPVFIAPFTLFLVFGQGIINIVFDPKYIDAYWVTCISLLSNVFAGFFYPLPFVIQLKEKVEISLISKVVVVLSLVLGVLFMKFYGIIGVAIATLLGVLFKNLLMMVLSRKLIRITHDNKIFTHYAMQTFILVALFMPFQSLYNSVAGLVIGVSLFVVVYAFLIIVIHPLDTTDFESLNRLMHAHSKVSKLVSKVEGKLKVLYPLRRYFYSTVARNIEEPV
jgi:O-antigen/teichoic acid export membrane protein